MTRVVWWLETDVSEAVLPLSSGYNNRIYRVYDLSTELFTALTIAGRCPVSVTEAGPCIQLQEQSKFLPSALSLHKGHISKIVGGGGGGG